MVRIKEKTHKNKNLEECWMNNYSKQKKKNIGKNKANQLTLEEKREKWKNKNYYIKQRLKRCNNYLR